MVQITVDELRDVQSNTQNIRNFCILAHVDHGKTTLSDFLISSNGIISQGLAGRVRYMDSREDEQDKGITMKSSCISLLYKTKLNPPEKFLINLIDSPGHVDFSHEVSTAVRLTDGAIVLVDVLEGVCTQTRSVLLQAFRENLKPCLVLNKIDRLILEKCMTPMEAYKQMLRILEQTNALMSTFTNTELYKQQNEDSESIENDYGDSYFAPEKGNVAFASAWDGWAFRINTFAQFFAKKMEGVKIEILQQTLWGEYYFDPKKKDVKKKPSKADQEPMFVQLILTNLFDVYKNIFQYPDAEKTEKILKTFSMNVDLAKKLQGDKRMLLRKVMGEWLPLADGILGMVVEQLPNPIVSQRNKLLKLVPELESSNSNSTSSQQQQQQQQLPNIDKKLRSDMKTYRKKLKKNVLQCDKSENAEVLVFVSKMLDMDLQSSSFIQKKDFAPRMPQPRKLEDSKTTPETELMNTIQEKLNTPAIIEEKEYFVGFARIFSGTIKKGQKLQILLPRYNTLKPNEHRYEFEVEHLFLLMGRSFEEVEQVPAGNIFGIGGISKYILKSATIASSYLAPIFSAMYFHAAPIVRIAIEPENVIDMPRLVQGLKLLNQSDPSVEVLVEENGEHVIMTSGEVHAERCLRDLNEKFCKGVSIKVSPPTVSFKETIITESEEMTPQQVTDSVVTVWTANKKCSLKLRAIPLPEVIQTFIDQNKDVFRKFNDEAIIDAEYLSFSIFDQLKAKFEEAGEFWAKQWDHLWSLGPKRSGPNILLNHIPHFTAPHFKSLIKKLVSEEASVTEEDSNTISSPTDPQLRHMKAHEVNIVGGFQIATSAGTLCEEPMMGVCFIIEDVNFELDATEQQQDGSNQEAAPLSINSYGTFGGQIISAVKEGCRKAFDKHQRRLVEAMYLCTIQSTQSAVGQAYGVLRKRRAKVLDEILEEGSELFVIKCNLPVAESFGFADELRSKTSGLAQPQVEFSHWQVLDVDPFYVPKTEDEIEEHGIGHEDKVPNIARDYINEVRLRKGLMINKKLVEHAEKQRNISKNV